MNLLLHDNRLVVENNWEKEKLGVLQFYVWGDEMVILDWLKLDHLR